MNNKTKKNNRWYWVIVLLLATAILLYFKMCDTPEPLDDQSKPSAAILKLFTDEVEENRVVFTLDFIVFRDSENVETQLKKKHFTIDSMKYGRSWFHFNPIHVSKRKLGEPGHFSALMLMDQSGSINSSDRQHFRLD